MALKNKFEKTKKQKNNTLLKQEINKTKKLGNKLRNKLSK